MTLDNSPLLTCLDQLKLNMTIYWDKQGSTTLDNSILSFLPDNVIIHNR